MRRITTNARFVAPSVAAEVLHANGKLDVGPIISESVSELLVEVSFDETNHQ